MHRPPQGYGPRAPRPWKLDPYRGYLRERWEQGKPNGHKLFLELQRCGYPGGYSRLPSLPPAESIVASDEWERERFAGCRN